jgi:hypothetical protein
MKTPLILVSKGSFKEKREKNLIMMSLLQTKLIL